MKEQLRTLKTITFPGPNKVICVFSDASEQLFAGIITLILPEDLNLPLERQHHEPFAFSSGVLKGSELRWTVPEKECFELVHTVTTFDDLLLRHASFRIMTDHRNLVYNYNLLSVDQSLARHTVPKQ